MADSAYQNALARKKELLRELKEIDEFLTLYRRYSGTKREETEPLGLELISASSEEEVLPPKAYRKNRGYPQVIGDAVERILKDAGRPMNRTEIADVLESRGIAIPSDDKPRYVGTILWRQGRRFRNIEGRGYWLKQEPLSD